jgi:hypothetical protein
VQAGPAEAAAALGSGGALFVQLSQGGSADGDGVGDPDPVQGKDPALFVRLGGSPAPSR